MLGVTVTLQILWCFVSQMQPFHARCIGTCLTEMYTYKNYYEYIEKHT